MGRIEDAIRQSKFENNYVKVIVNVLYTSNWIVGIQQEIFKPFGLTYQQYNVLRILRGRHPTPCTSKEIREVMVDKKPDLTRLIDRLQIKELINRRIDHNNRSKLAISLAPKGLEVLAKIDPEFVKIYDKLKGITPEEASVLSDLLDKMRS